MLLNRLLQRGGFVNFYLAQIKKINKSVFSLNISFTFALCDKSHKLESKNNMRIFTSAIRMTMMHMMCMCCALNFRQKN